MPRFLIGTEIRHRPLGAEGDNTRTCLINPSSIVYAHESSVTRPDQDAIDICLENGDWVTIQGDIAGLEKMIRAIKE